MKHKLWNLVLDALKHQVSGFESRLSTYILTATVRPWAIHFQIYDIPNQWMCSDLLRSMSLSNIIKIFLGLLVRNLASTTGQFPKGDHLVNSHELCDGVCIDVTWKNSNLITLRSSKAQLQVMHPWNVLCKVTNLLFHLDHCLCHPVKASGKDKVNPFNSSRWFHVFYKLSVLNI